MRSDTRPAGPPPAADTRSCNVFFGIFPPPDVRAAMAAQVAQLREAVPVRGRWSDPQRYHVTVQFLGRFPLSACLATDGDRLAGIRAAGRSLEAEAFDLRLDTTGSFARSRVGWLGCTQPPAALLALWQRLGSALDEQGAPRERAPQYVPHVTVLRDARERWPAQAIVPIAWHVDALVLARSREGPGPYEVLDAWPLA